MAASFACSVVLGGFVFPFPYSGVENQIKRRSTEVNSLQLFKKFVELDKKNKSKAVFSYVTILNFCVF